MFHSIIGEYDVFFSGNRPEYKEVRSGSGVAVMIKENGQYRQHSFFSTDPRDYLNKSNTF